MRILSLHEKITVKGEFRWRGMQIVRGKLLVLLSTENAVDVSYEVTGKPISFLLSRKQFHTSLRRNTLKGK